VTTAPDRDAPDITAGSMDPDTLADRIAAGTAPVILDVRSALEFARGHVPGAIHVPFWRINAHIDRVPAQPDDEVVVYCGHGPRAAWAEAALRRRGFRRVKDLTGHWARWTRQGRERSRRADL
jgi:rhodanese-related sulfurtransferase